MSKPLAIALLVLGVILLILGINTHDTVTAGNFGTSHAASTDHGLWVIIGGLIGIIIGGLALLFPRHGKARPTSSADNAHALISPHPFRSRRSSR